MPGIYLHIPFCKKACHYCDFHFSTSSALKNDMLEAMRKEIKLRNSYLDNAEIETIYFGGGTPSVLNTDEIKYFIDLIYEEFNVSSTPEITLEANPDDLYPQKVKELKNTDINRFSIGIQSFFEEDLRWMNRAHTAREADSSIKRVQDAGFENITADLIYGYPLLSDEKWEFNIRKLLEINIPHISSYSMTIEPRTALADHIKNGKQVPMDDAQSAAQFKIMMQELNEASFDHYEISNFAKPGWHSRHNSNYWEGIPYLGIGPSAHSFNRHSRQWNVSNNQKYINSLRDGKLEPEYEKLTEKDKLNEYIMTSIRTSKGMDLSRIAASYGSEISDQINEELMRMREKGWLEERDNKVTLNEEGKLFADHIASELFIENQF